MRPLFLLLAAALAAPAAALDDMDASYEPSEAVGVCLAGHPDLRQWVHAYEEEQQQEWYGLYRDYAALVRDRRNAGWSNGNMGNFVTNWSRDGQGPHWNYSYTEITKEIDRLKQLHAAEERPERRAEFEREIRKMEESRDGRFGTCNDWSREVFGALNRKKPTHFVIHEGVRDGTQLLGQNIGAHAYTLVCPKFNGSVKMDRCIAFDPWKNGLPELYKGEDMQRSGPSGAQGCFASASARAQLGAR